MDTPASFSMASSTSRDWKHSASSMARTMWAFVLNAVRPRMVPRASSRQCGASSPVKAGTKYTPAQSGTERASVSVSAGSSITPRLSFSQLIPTAPVATAPSSPYAVLASAPSLNAT